MDLEKLKRLQAKASTQTGGKGTPRRKIVVKSKAGGAADDKKLQAGLKKLGIQPIQGIEEVNMFRQDGKVIHFTAPKVHAAVQANTFAIYGSGQEKELTELVPGILNQLGPDSLANLRKLAESYQAMQGGAGAGMNLGGEKEADDDDVPDLVESFDVEDKKEGEQESASKLEEVS